MAEFVKLNSGLNRRICTTFRFRDFSCEELARMFLHGVMEGAFSTDEIKTLMCLTTFISLMISAGCFLFFHTPLLIFNPVVVVIVVVVIIVIVLVVIVIVVIVVIVVVVVVVIVVVVVVVVVVFIISTSLMISEGRTSQPAFQSDWIRQRSRCVISFAVIN